MIETKEQYEEYRKGLYVILAPDGENNVPMSEVWETIEALRKVARYLKYEVMLEENGEFEFDEIFPDIAGWITDE